jgi:hypothetical protein
VLFVNGGKIAVSSFRILRSHAETAIVCVQIAWIIRMRNPFVIFTKSSQRVTGIDSRAIRYICTIGMMGPYRNFTQLITGFDPCDPARSICIRVSISSINRKSIVSKSQQRRVLCRINNVQSVGIIKITNI